MFDLNEVPKRVPPDSPLAPQWYRLEDRKGDKGKGELMLAVWMGTQADEAFPESWHSDAATANIRSKVYLSPKLWYLRVNVIEAQDLIPSDKGRYPEVFVKAILGNQMLRTRISPSRTVNPMWNEDLMFVAAEPFEEPLILSVEDRVAPNKDDVLGRCAIPLQYMDRRYDHKPVNTRWFNLGEKKKEHKFSSRIHMRVCLEGGYHVLDESTHYSSDLRPTAKQLWKSSIGVLELGVLNAQGLMPMKTKDGRGTTDAYCVAKYGQKWVRTRTIIDSFAPKWNEQYTWEVFDPCTVITLGSKDGGGGGGGGARDSRIGKVRIRLSTLEADRVYTHSYPLLVLHPNGVKKMGEIHLAIRFTCSSLLNMMHMYSQPLLPKMHYIHPLTVSQLDSLRHQATQIVSMRLSRAEPPLRKEIVEYMLDVGSHIPRHPPHMDTRLSHAESAHPDELDEEFDTFPTSRPSDIVRMRYDRLRSIAGRIQTVVGDLATQGERLQSLLSWRDPRATALFVIFCLIAAVVLYVTPFQVVALLTGLYVLRHPRFRHKLPSVPLNFFRRLPARTDCML
ncbi:FT-interacting protein 4 [Linum perenne]